MVETLCSCFKGKGKQPECKRSRLELLKRNILPRKIKIKRKQKGKEDDNQYRNQTSSDGNGSSCCETLPPDVMEKILERVNLRERIRLSIVCKDWRSIVMQRCGAKHELPWLLLPRPRYFGKKYMRFYMLSESKVVKLKLPKQVRGDWIYGSSKGWLIMVKEQGLNSSMCLLNPISGALHQLPPLRTIPSFKEFVKTRAWKRLRANGFFRRVALSTSDDPNYCTVAAIFNDENTLGLCRPGDKTWSVSQVLDIDPNASFSRLTDVLFSSDTLYALIQSEKDGFVDAATRTLNFGDNAVALKLVYDKHEDDLNIDMNINQFYEDLMIAYNAECRSMLSESTSNEVLLIHQMKNYTVRREYDQDGEGGVIDCEVPGFDPHMSTRSFKVYKIFPGNESCFLEMQVLGDQLIFFGDGGCFSHPTCEFKESQRNCIYFATNSVWDLETAPKTYDTNEIGSIFYLDGRRINKPSFPSLVVSLRYQGTFFAPRF